MPSTGKPQLDLVLYCIAAVVVLAFGFQIGKLFGSLAARKTIASKEQELFTTQRGFKNLYDQELTALKTANADLTTQVQTLTARVEDYRKKAAGYGGLFSGSSKKADAMYALLMENEALEEALHSQNEKLRQERTDQLKETMRSTGYRRVLISQLMNDERIKSYVAEIINDERRLPPPSGNSAPQLGHEQTGG